MCYVRKVYNAILEAIIYDSIMLEARCCPCSVRKKYHSIIETKNYPSPMFTENL